jgi:mono/diheme cytochrome c family protein
MVALTVAAMTCAGCELDDPISPNGFTAPDPPSYQETVIADVRPPPIMGGTLLVSRDGSAALVADPERDRVVLVDLVKMSVRNALPTGEGSMPTRLAEDAERRAHIALRGSGELVTLDIASGSELGRRAVCGAPRGVTYDSRFDRVLVVCADDGGQLVELSPDPAQGELARTIIGEDARDVVPAPNGGLFVSRFRQARLDLLGQDRSLVEGSRPHAPASGSLAQPFDPGVAWRTQALPDGRAVMVHQRALSGVLPAPAPDAPAVYYGGDCTTTVVQSGVTLFDKEGQPQTLPGFGGLGVAPLPVDVAVSPAGDRIAVVSATGGFIYEGPTDAALQQDACLGSGALYAAWPLAQPIAAAYIPNAAALIVQTREPSRLEIRTIPDDYAQPMLIELGGEPRTDSGHALFHGNPEGFVGVPCASCHPEGGEDGHVWEFENIGKRRTQSLAGGILETAPFHWDGDLEDMGAVMDEVFVHRMGGATQDEARIDAIRTWLDALPAAPTRRALDPAAAARGAALFADEEVACASCHSGSLLTNNTTVAVGTDGGRAFQVPSLRGLAARAPFMHDGCAPTLMDRFTDSTCGGGDAHGKTSQLDEAELRDLVAYLMTL